MKELKRLEGTTRKLQEPERTTRTHYKNYIQELPGRTLNTRTHYRMVNTRTYWKNWVQELVGRIGRYKNSLEES